MASDKPIVWVAGQCVAGPAWELLGGVQCGGIRCFGLRHPG